MALTDAQKEATIDYGEDKALITLAGTTKIGDALGWSSGWKRALATTGTAIQLRCVAGEDGASGQKIKAYFGKTVVSGSRFTGGTAGGSLYVAEGTDNGQYTETAPSTSGDCNTVIGYILSATEIVVLPSRNTDSVA
ncbi:MAG: hypothetical protein CMI54_02915 [Parcubacteria group bacterium]|nr:hypothetical protein [Parcubacteria group bacterium]|tara:strand:- start:15451 stop:15861 length:411 start_codon:yes stop_codon:yes gene_type:complete